MPNQNKPNQNYIMFKTNLACHMLQHSNIVYSFLNYGLNLMDITYFL